MISSGSLIVKNCLEESTYHQHRREMMGTLCRRQTIREVCLSMYPMTRSSRLETENLDFRFCSFVFGSFFSQLDVGGALECVIRVSPGGRAQYVTLRSKIR